MSTTTTYTGVRIVDMPDLGAVTDTSSVVGEHAGSGRFGAVAMANYITTRAGNPANVKTYGAKGDGSTDDTAAINAAIAAAPANGAVYFPAGNYHIASAIAVSKTLSLHGDGRYVSTLTTTSATADILNVTAAADIFDLGFNASVTRTNGNYVNFSADTATRSRLSRFWMLNGHLGVQISASDIQVDDGEILAWVATGGGIQVDSGLALAISRCYLQQGEAPGLGFGIRVLSTGDLLISDCSVAGAGNALVIAPASGQSVVSLWAHHTYFDTSQVGVTIAPTGTGAVHRCRFDNCWMSSAVDNGVAISSPSPGSVNGLSFLGCQVYGNGSNGFDFVDANALATKIVDCEIAGNAANGVSFFAGGSYFMVCGCKIGSSAGWGNNGGDAINLGAASSAYHITDNDLTGSSAGSLGGVGVQTGSSPGRAEFISRNIGYVDSAYGTATVTAAATSVVVSHGLAGAPPLNRILLTALTGIGSALSYWVSAVTATTFTINTGAPPGGTLTLSWQARMACS